MQADSEPAAAASTAQVEPDVPEETMEAAGAADVPTPASATDDGSQVRRWEKRRCALLLGFVGTGYHGFQNNPDVPTIEGKLEHALNELGMLGPNYEGRLGTVCVAAHRAMPLDHRCHTRAWPHTLLTTAAMVTLCSY